MRSLIVIPAYNEEKRIGQVLTNLLDNNFEVAVVDDCSSDNTLEVVRNFPVHVLEHYVNQGQGGALKTGTYYALRNNFDAVAHFDADGQHRIEDLKKILEILDAEDYEVILGSRFLDDSTDLPDKKKKILFLAKVFSSTMLQLNFSDPQNGLRAFKTSVLPKIIWQKNDFQHCTEILQRIAKENLKYKEVPIKVNYDNYSMSKTVKPRISMGWKLLANKILDNL